MGGTPARRAERCWGAQLQGDNRTGECRFTRKRDTRHFKSKFCARCRWSMVVPANRVRVLSDEVAALLGNRRSFGMWTTAPARIGGFQYRVVNNTQGCFASKLCVFEKDPPASVEWPIVDAHLRDADGTVRMCVSKGTVVPISLVRDANRARGPPPDLELASELEPEPESEPEPEVKLEPVVKPEPGPGMLQLDWLAPDIGSLESLGPLLPVTECMPELGSEPEPAADEPALAVVPVPVASVEDEAEAEAVPRSVLMKRNGVDRALVRKQRNRESAATSRERKRQYVAHLEGQVDALEQQVQTLQQENAFWKSLGLDT